MYAAQAIPPIDAEIVKTETNPQGGESALLCRQKVSSPDGHELSQQISLRNVFMQDQKFSYEMMEQTAIIKMPAGVQENIPHFVFREFSDLCNVIDSDDQIKAVVITEAGPGAFRMEEAAIPQGLQDDPSSFSVDSSMAEPVSKLEKPVIAAIQGDAVGMGLELVMACDIRIASETSGFGLPQIKRHLIPGNGGTQRLPRLVGRAKALEMILTGNTIQATEAYRIGLVNRITSCDQVITTAMAMAKEMAVKGPIALRYAKEAVHEGMDMTLEQGLRLEADLYMLIHTTHDRAEGIRAFLENRKPDFTGS